MVDVRMPNGDVVSFPDDMPREQIRSMIETKFPNAGQPQQNTNNELRPMELFQGSDAAQRGIMQGVTLGHGDELMAGLGTPIQMAVDAFQGKEFDPGASYNRQLDQIRGQISEEQQRNPNAFLAGQIGGSLALGSSASNAGLTFMKGATPTVASMAPRAALEGATYGAIAGLGEGEDFGEKIRDAIVGGAFGAAAGGLVGGIGGALANRAASKGIPTEIELNKIVDDLYNTARNTGTPTTPQQNQQLRNTIVSFLSDEGLITPSGRVAEYPALRQAMALLDDYANAPMNVQQAQAIRNSLKDIASSNTAAERRIGYELLKEFDGFTAQMAPELAEARGLYAQLMKARQLQDLVELAQANSTQYSQGGLDLALRNQFRNLERQIIRGTSRGWTPDEIAAISEVAQGGSLANFLQRVGKWAPTNPLTAGLGGGGIVGAGIMTGNVPAIALGTGIMGAGVGAKAGANMMTSNAANRAVQLALSGNPAAFHLPQATSRATSALAQQAGVQLPPMAQSSIPEAIRKFL